MRTGRPKSNNIKKLNPSYQQLSQYFKEWIQTLGFSKSMIYGYPNMLFYFLQYLQNKNINQINQLTQTHINDYFLYLQYRQNLLTTGALSDAHLNKNFDCIDKFIECLHHQNNTLQVVPTNYRILQNREKYIQTIKVLTTSEIQNLYLTAEQLFPQMSHQHQIPRRAIATLILDLCYGCGMRKEEAIKLQIKDIDFDKNTIFINQAKGYKDRFIPINTTISKRLQLFIYEHRRFFNVSHERIFPLSKGSMEYYIKQLKNQSDYASIREKNTSLHMLRHSIATHLLQNGMNIEQIAKFLGHNSLESTQIYTHLIHEK